MKHFFLIVLTALGIVGVASAQSPFEPPSITSMNAMLRSTHDSTFVDTVTFTDTVVFAGRDNVFMLGHQWSNALPGVNKRLYMNFYNVKEEHLFASHGRLYDRYPRTTGKPLYISLVNHTLWGYALSLQFDPEAPSTDVNDFFTPTSGDSLGAVFGFREKRGGKRGASGMSNRYIYIPDSLPSGDTGMVILSNPVAGEQIHRLESWQTTETKANGTRWYVAINLRRSNSTWDTSTNRNDTVLSIKLPYLFKVTNSSRARKVIHFDSVTAFNPVGVLDTTYRKRGRWMDKTLVKSGSADTIFTIRRSMLPKYSDTCDITLSAYFTAADPNDSTIPLKLNQPFRINTVTGLGEIDTLGMEVRYFGKCDIAIDWIRLETPSARALFRGEQDSAIAQRMSISYAAMRKFRNDGIPNAKLFRFYGNDEPTFIMYRAQRYASFLVENFLTTEGGYNERYNSVVPQPTYWGSVPRYDAGIAKVPYAKYVMQDVAFTSPRKHTLGINGGWEYLWWVSSPDATRNFSVNSCDGNYDGSGYEKYSYASEGWAWNRFCSTNLNSQNWVASPKGIKDTAFIDSATTWYFPEEAKRNILFTDAGLLANWEANITGFSKNPTTIFSAMPWYSNIWIASEWYTNHVVYDTANRYVDVAYSRANTGEELRLSQWSALALGAKGLLYDNFDYATTYQADNDRKWNRVGVTGGYGDIDSSVLYNDTSGNFILQSNKSGSDFIQQGEPLELDKYIHFDSTAIALGISKNRIYLGRKTQRLEIMKLHDRINIMQDTLLRLRLMGWYGKGHYTTKSAYNNDTSYLTRFMRLDSGYLKTRAFYRDSTEGWDSTFCDVMIHKVTGVSMDSSFAIAVVNRRTNPLLRLGDTLTFYTTAEFDSLTLGSDSLWKTRRYKQGGAREITIPFNYQDSIGYALLRIRELGGGIDTVIGQDRPLAVKFLPGEGKMFKVEILHPDTTLAGNLSYTNQRKLVGYPKLGNSDTMFYHLTYHKQIPGLSRSAVYYRRSKAITTNSSTQNIIWENEIPVSVNIRAVKGDTATLVNPNCAYPSLVVRYDDSTQVNKVYIVYACVDDDTCFYSTKKRIVESVLRADDNTQTFTTPLMAETLSKFHGSLDEYGTPMINASDSGNYYCWADSLLGIVAGWKRTDAQYLQDSKSISYNLTIDQLPVDCKHPSLNSYSRIALKEKDCALVWQEKCYSGDNVTRSRILYTRLQMINGILNSYLSPTLSPANGVQIFGPSGYIAELNYGGSQYANHHIPSVYREISDNVVYSEDQQRDTRFDCVSWHSYEFTSNPGTPLGAIYRRVLSIYDTNGVANLWGSDGISRIRASSTYLGNVSLSQGDAELVPVGGYMHNFSARSHIMTFTESPVYTFGGSPPYRKLWQIQSNSYFAPSFHDTSLSAFQSTSKAFVIDNDGAVGQTAALPRMNTQEEWRKNRRVYEGVTVGSLRRIQASAEYFLKQTASSDIEPSIFSGFHDGESTYMLSNPILNGQMLSLERVKRLRGEAGKFGGRHGFTDTLETNWFTVGDEANLMLKSIGKNADLVSAFVERRSDGERFAVQLRTSDDTTALWTRIPLLRGGVEEYKFFMVKNSVGRGEEVFTIPDYGEEMVLGAMKTSISFNKGNNDIQAIDLGRKAGAQASIRVFPNPAQDKVSVVVLGNNPKDVWHIKVMNVLGDVMSEHDDKTSSLLEIVTEDYPSGVYYITAESGKLNATARFVIMK